MQAVRFSTNVIKAQHHLFHFHSSDLRLVHFCDQALSQKELEKTSLSEQLAALQQELHSAAMELEQTKRESLSKQEQDKVKKNKNKTIIRASTHCFLTLDV